MPPTLTLAGLKRQTFTPRPSDSCHSSLLAPQTILARSAIARSLAKKHVWGDPVSMTSFLAGGFTSGWLGLMLSTALTMIRPDDGSTVKGMTRDILAGRIARVG